MRIFVSSRQTGKTTNCIDWFARDPNHRAIICIDGRERDRLIRKIAESSSELSRARLWQRNILYPEALMSGSPALRGLQIKGVWIDNFDLVLPRLIGYWGEIIATSTEPVEVISVNPGDRFWT